MNRVFNEPDAVLEGMLVFFISRGASSSMLVEDWVLLSRYKGEYKRGDGEMNYPQT